MPSQVLVLYVNMSLFAICANSGIAAQDSILQTRSQVCTGQEGLRDIERTFFPHSQERRGGTRRLCSGRRTLP